MAGQSASALIPAATILLLRDGPHGLEVFMVVRHHQIDFASGALVFPGGKVDAGDLVPSIRKRATGADGLDDATFAMRVAAIREAYEECGVLLARPAGSGEPISGDALIDLEPYRDKLNAGEIGIGDFLDAEDLVLACDLLTPYAHWITPNMMPKRFDTHFFLAEAPADHVAVHDGTESVDSVWLRPGDAVREADEGKWTIIFPTRLNVSKLGRSGCVADALSAARAGSIVTVEPRIEQRGDQGPVLCIPAEADYGLTEAPLDMAR